MHIICIILLCSLLLLFTRFLSAVALVIVMCVLSVVVVVIHVLCPFFLRLAAAAEYVANSKKSIGMIAGGTGITPMLQVCGHVVWGIAGAVV